MLNQFKSIAFFFGENEQGSYIAEHAVALAQRHDAHLIGIAYLEPLLDRYVGFARGEAAMRQTMNYLRSEYEKKVLEASQHIEELASKHGVSIEFRVIWSDTDAQGIANHLLHCDLVMIGFETAPFSPERLLLTGGAPVLVVPQAWQGKSIGRRIILAWNASRQARRALAEAMPFIASAEQVKVLVVNAEKHPERYGEDPGADITAYLARHEAPVTLERMSSNGTAVPDTIRSYAVANGADLLVIGAYSRARIGELLLGGVTRNWLSKPSIPLLLAQ